jgi:hypothetical protein
MLINDLTANSGGAPAPGDERLFGVEVEYEQVGEPPRVQDLGWTSVHDGSLRDNGVEFITPPVPLRTAVASFRKLNKYAIDCGWVDNVRTGIHVHVDMRDLTVAQVQGVLAAYAAFEPLMFSLVNPDRETNIYCVPWYRASDQAKLVPHIAGGPGDTETRAGRSLVKYSALFIRPLWVFGTIEFRHAPTWKDPALFRRWMCAINRLVEWGKHESPQSVVEKCGSDPNSLVRSIFGWTMAHVPDPEGLMDEVNSLATVDEMTPYTYKLSDWEWDQREGAMAGVGYHVMADPDRLRERDGHTGLIVDDYDEDDYDEDDNREDY